MNSTDNSPASIKHYSATGQSNSFFFSFQCFLLFYLDTSYHLQQVKEPFPGENVSQSYILLLLLKGLFVALSQALPPPTHTSKQAMRLLLRVAQHQTYIKYP